MSIVIDSNAPYATSFGAQHAEDAVYMSAEDPLLGRVLAVVYKSVPTSPKLSVILLGNHGTSGYVDMTLDSTSRYFGACRGLAAAHYASPVRKALAIAALRTFATMDKPLRKHLLSSTLGELYEDQLAMKYYDEAAAGALGSRFRLVHGKFPSEIGKRLLEAGFLEAKQIRTGNIDVIYEDSDFTIDQNNDLVYMLGEQLEQLFDPLSEYSPEPTEKVYSPPADSLATLEDDTEEVREICEELYILQSRVRADLVALLQEFLIPLRVSVLSGEIPDLTIGVLNTLFPPTIDEIFRITNLFYDALQQALPFGSFEVLRACGTTIPYFYRASMRHEAATRNFSRNLASYSPELQSQMEHFSPQRIETIMQFSLHLARTKMILDRLMRCRKWSAEEEPLAKEYHAVADSTIHSFGMQPSVSEAYDRRTFTLTGKLLVEIAEGWPTELEYGWMSRRVVTIFDAVDIIEKNPARRQLHHIIILFTDAVLILEPAAPIPLASMSGLHVPAVGDMLMHAMVNEAPLDKYLPPLRVVAWAPVLEVVFASYGERSLLVSMPGAANNSTTNTAPSTNTKGNANLSPKSQSTANSNVPAITSGFHSRVYKLVRTDHVADKFVELLSKAKVTTKTQPFHLFRMSQRDLQLYMTVHEIQGYNEEVNRFPIAIFLNSEVSESTLKQHQLLGAVSLSFSGSLDQIRIQVVSALGYSSDQDIAMSESRAYCLSEISYLATLALSSQNSEALQPIVAGNATMVASLIKWAQAPPSREWLGHRRGLVTPKQEASESLHPNITPNRRLCGEDHKHRLRKVSHLERSSEDEIAPNTTSNAPLSFLDRKPSVEYANVHDRGSGSTQSLGSFTSGSHYEFPPRKPSGVSRLSSHQSNFDEWESLDGGSYLDSADEAEQRDVDAWYHHISHRGASSLSSGVSDVDLGVVSSSTVRPLRTIYDDRDDENQHSLQSTSEAIQLGPFLTKSDSLLYNQHAGRAFAALAPKSDSQSGNELSSRNSTNSSFGQQIVQHSESQRSITSTIGSLSLGCSECGEQDDFGWLADYVSDDTEVMSRSSSFNKLYPGLRDPSIVKLGNYVLSSDRSEIWPRHNSAISVLPPIVESSVAPLNVRRNANSNKRDAPPTPTSRRSSDSGTSADEDIFHEFLGSDEATPRLEDLRFSSDSELEESFGKSVTKSSDLAFTGVHSGDEETHGLLDSSSRSAEKIMRNSRWLAAMNQGDDNRASLELGDFSYSTPGPTATEQSSSAAARRGLVPRLQSVDSFSRMVMRSSLNSLQLASITVQLDQVIAVAAVNQRPLLTAVKNKLTYHYAATHQFSKGLRPETPIAANSLRAEEQEARQAAAWSVWTLISLGKFNLVSPYLEIEWHRRTLLSEALGSRLPAGLWS